MSLLRIVVYGDDMLRAIVPNSARAFDFQKIFGLSYEQVCRRTSVHTGSSIDKLKPSCSYHPIISIKTYTKVVALNILSTGQECS